MSFKISVVLLFVWRPTNGTLGAHGIERLSETQSLVGGPIPPVPLTADGRMFCHNTNTNFFRW